MSFRAIGSYGEMLEGLKEKHKNYILIYKKGSEASDCSYDSIEKVASRQKELNVLTVDVNQVRDIHGKYGITSAPSLLVFDGDRFVKSVKGCNDEGFYESLFEQRLFTAKAVEGEKPQKRVTVYTTPTCTWCTTLKRHLDHHGIRYREVDVSRDQKAAETMTRKSGQQGVPQTDINGQMIVGFDKVKLNTLLEIYH